MKNVISIILVFLLMFSFAGCNNADDNGQTLPNGPVSKQTIYFNTNGGTSVSSIKANTLNSSPITSKDGYLFVGWFLDETLTVPAVFPLDVYNDMTLYAKWLKIVGEKYCTNCQIKWDTGFSSALVYDLTPNGFDLVELAKRGYYIKISVSYRVYYRKDYDVWLDIGYAGSPKYEIYLVDSKGVGDRREDLSTSTSGSNRTVELTRPASSLIGDKITLTVSTNNIQNIIFFVNKIKEGGALPSSF